MTLHSAVSGGKDMTPLKMENEREFSKGIIYKIVGRYRDRKIILEYPVAGYS